MKIIEDKTEGIMRWVMSRQEIGLLVALIDAYPATPVGRRAVLSRNDDSKEAFERQEFLDEAMAEQCRENRAKAQAVLRAPGVVQYSASKGLFTFRTSEAPWLLQIFNEVRVGSWEALGAPEEPKLDENETDQQVIRSFFLMSVSALFEEVLLSSLGAA